MTDSTTITLRVSEELKRQLDALAKTTKRTRSFLAAEAISHYLEEQAWQVELIKTRLAEADGGQLIEGERIEEWLSSWGSADELPPPECE